MQCHVLNLMKEEARKINSIILNQTLNSFGIVQRKSNNFICCVQNIAKWPCRISLPSVDLILQGLKNPIKLRFLLERTKIGFQALYLVRMQVATSKSNLI